MNFYNINEKHKALILKAENEAEHNEGEMSEIIYNELVNSESNMLEFGESFLLMAKEKQLLATAIKAEVKAMQDRAKKLDAQAERYKSLAIEDCGVEAGERPEFSLKCTKSKATNIVDEEKVDFMFRKVKQVETIDKAAILKALKAGEEVAGCELVEKNNWKLK